VSQVGGEGVRSEREEESVKKGTSDAGRGGGGGGAACRRAFLAFSRAEGEGGL